jgi:cobalt-zinc-cadmium efflux system outer membrane protein
MSRTWKPVCLLFAAIQLVGSPVLAQPVTATSPNQAALTLERLEGLALENNPTIRQAAAGVDASRARARQAGAWPNPVIGYTGEEISPGPVIRGGEHGFFVEQTIPLGGKLRLGRQVFERAAIQAESLAQLQEQRIRSAVRTLYYEALALERRVEVQDRLAQLAGEAAGISAQLYNVGAADRPHVLESEIEWRRAQIELNAARNRRFAVWRRLAAMVGDASLQPQPLAGSIDTAIPEIDRGGALAQALERSPEIGAARAGVERNRALVAQARKATFPDLFLRGGAGYNRELLEVVGPGRVEPVGWEAAVEAGVSVPLFNRNAGGVAAARAEQARAEADLRRLELALESRLAVSFDEYLTALRAAEIYRAEVLPRAEEAYRLYLTRYREMGAAYPQVLIAQRTLFQMNDEYLQNLETAWRAALRIQGFLLEDDGLVAPEMVRGEPR